MSPFTQYKPWMIDRYGDALFRIPVEIANSCPHGRCAFCTEQGARAQQTLQQESPTEQAEAAIQFSKRRYRAKKFMLYIQAFTTDLTASEQQQIIIDLLNQFDFLAISIGTRPDCLPPEALDFLEGLKTSGSTPLEVWVELGIQTIHDQTLELIHRGHNWACSKQAIHDLADRGIHVAPHIILGLPNETATEWNQTAEELAKLPLFGIKIHNLHIMRGTDFEETSPPTLTHWEYAEALIEFLRRIPASLPIMRISTDTPDDQLIAPHWHLEKGQFRDYVIQQMTMREITQGDLIKPENLKFETGKTPQITDDGSITFFSEEWKEHYHTKAGARLEAEKKFVIPSGLTSKLQTSNLKLLDVCFGLGNNTLAALCAQRKTDVQHTLDITALEMDKRIVRAASEHFQPLETDPVNWTKTLATLLEHNVILPTLGKIDLHFGDARYLIQSLEDSRFDIVFHDPFSSQHCPELWTVDFFKQLHRVMKPEGILLTYSSSQPVRGAMREAGFHLAETQPGQPMGNGTAVSWSQAPLLSFSPIEDLDPRRSTPYRDPTLCATSKAILRQRQEAIESV